MTEDKPLAGKLALVTGASRGIGAATAVTLGQAGAHVILVARTTQALEEVEDRIHQAGGSATIAPLDLSKGEDIGKLAVAAADRWDSLDILVLNAAMLGSLSPVEHIDAKEYARLLTLNVVANQAMIAAFDRLMRRSDRAEVIAVTSSVGSEPRAFWGAYGSSKAALENLILSYGDETDYSGKVRVHVIDPGATRTRMRELAFPGEEPESLKPPQVVADFILARLLSDAPGGERVAVDA